MDEETFYCYCGRSQSEYVFKQVEDEKEDEKLMAKELGVLTCKDCGLMYWKLFYNKTKIKDTRRAFLIL